MREIRGGAQYACVGTWKAAARQAEEGAERGRSAVQGIPDREGRAATRHQAVGVLSEAEAREVRQELYERAGRMVQEGSELTGRCEVHGAHERASGRNESRRLAETPPEGPGEVDAREGARPGVQREVLAGRASRAAGLEAGTPAVRRPVAGRGEVQLSDGEKQSADRAAEHRLGEVNEAVQPATRRGAAELAPGRAKRVREDQAGEWMRP